MKQPDSIIFQNIQDIKRRVSAAAKRSGRSPRDVTLLAVTKNVSLEEIRQAISAGIGHIGENKVQEAQKKFQQLGPGIAWHMIGHLQTNKARIAAAIFDMVQSVDSERVAEALQREAFRLDRQLDVLVEVNIGNEETKFGIARAETERLVRAVGERKSLRLRGLMCMAPYVSDPELARPFFRDLAQLFRSLRPAAGPGWDTLSMGMTHDFEVAIEEGSTLVRIGTGIFHSSSPGRRV